MPRFLTLFPLAENIHLVKDVGMIPYILYREHGYDCTLATYKNCNFDYLESEVKGLKIRFIRKIFHNYTLDTCLFIVLNFWRYDIIQCYHFIRPSLFFLFLFKLLKNITFDKSFTYLKLDADDGIKSINFKPIHIFFLNCINLISVESKGLYKYLNNRRILEKKIEYIPNGFFSKGERKTVDFNSKENLIITVGRIGTFQKYNEILLEAFKNFVVKNNDWNLQIIGPVEPEFQNYIQNYYKANPALINKVSFTGVIANRDALQEKYEKAKIFVLTSRYESFGLVYLEAMQSGCTIISSAITPAFDITDNVKYGAIFPVGDSIALAKTLEEVVNNPIKLENDCELIQDFAYDNFTWSKICNDLHNMICDERN